MEAPMGACIWKLNLTSEGQWVLHLWGGLKSPKYVKVDWPVKVKGECVTLTSEGQVKFLRVECEKGEEDPKPQVNPVEPQR